MKELSVFRYFKNLRKPSGFMREPQKVDVFLGGYLIFRKEKENCRYISNHIFVFENHNYQP
jgi:hypothetical protein